MTYWTIRPASPADEDVITGLHARCITDVFLGRHDPSDDERASRQRSWTGPIGSPDPRHALLVAEHEDGLIGFAAVGPTRDPDGDVARTGELRVILVDADHRGRGAGSALLDAGEHALLEAGFVSATLWVLPDNEPAVSCYERRGWRPDGTDRLGTFGGLEFRSVRYAKRLASVGIA